MGFEQPLDPSLFRDFQNAKHSEGRGLVQEYSEEGLPKVIASTECVYNTRHGMFLSQVADPLDVFFSMQLASQESEFPSQFDDCCCSPVSTRDILATMLQRPQGLPPVETADFEEAFRSKGIQNYRDLLKQLCYQDRNYYRAPVTSCSFIGKSSTVSHEARAFAAASDLNRQLISVLSYTHDPSLPLDLVFNSDSLTVLSCFSPSIVLSSQRILNCLEICLSNFKQIIDLFPRA